MSQIGSISLGMEAEVDKFVKDITKASTALKPLQMNMTQVAGAAVDFAAVFAGGSIAGLGVLVSETIDSITQQTKLADRLELSTEMLAGFRQEAIGMGVSGDTATQALEHLNKVVGEGISGNEEARQAFKDIGLDLRDLVAIPADERLQVVANAFKDMGSNAERAGNAQKLFGRSGVELVDVLSKGAEGLQDSTDKAVELGTALTRIDAEKVVQAKEAFEELHEIFNGILATLTVQLAPFISAFTQQLIHAGEEGGGMSKKIVNGFETVLQTIAEAADWIKFLEATFYAVRVAVDVVALAVGKWAEISLDLMNVWAQFIPGLSGIVANAKTITEQFNRGMVEQAEDDAQAANKAWGSFINGDNEQKVSAFFGKIRADAQTAADKVATTLEQAKDKSQQANVDSFDRNTGTKAAKKALEEMQKEAEKLKEKLETPAEKFMEHIGRAAELLKQGFIDKETFERALKADQKEFAQADDKANGAGASFRQIDPSLLSLEGLKGEKKGKQEITSEQLAQTNSILMQILQKNPRVAAILGSR